MIAYPFVMLPAALSAYAIMSFVIASLIIKTDDPSGGLLLLAKVISIILGLVGVSAILGFFIAIPIGIYLIAVPSKPKAK